MQSRSRKTTLLVVVFVLAGSTSAGQKLEKAAPIGTESAALDELRSEGYHALYNLDYEGARRNFQEMVRLFPEHPAGPQSLAASLWLEELNRSRRLSATLYSAESLQQGTGELTDPRVVEKFLEWNRKAKQLSEARLRRNSSDTEALYFLGAAEALKAVFTASIQRRFLAASRDASSAVDHHREVLKLDPHFQDAGLSIGLYSYVLGSLPLPVRLLASLGGIRGSKKRGLETLERVAREGRWARDMARVLLIDLYKREKRWNEALAISRDLGNRYPGNYTFLLQTADTLVRRSQAANRDKGGSGRLVTEDEQEAFKIFNLLIKSSKTKASVLDVIHFRYGETLLMAMRPQDAAKEFLAAAQQADSDSRLKSLARLRAAQSFDLAGKRQEALAEYTLVLKGPKVGNLHEQARRGLRQPYRSEK